MSLIIFNSPPLGSIRRGPAKHRAGGFSVGDEAAVEARVAAPESVGGLAALIGLQSGCEPVEDREARRYGQTLLGHLDALHRALLGEAPPADLLRALGAAASSAPGPAQDAGLADAVAGIRLRAMVEAARYGAA